MTKIKYYKDFTGVTASIKEHLDGTATLKISTEKKSKTYKNFKSAYSAWSKYCN